MLKKENLLYLASGQYNPIYESLGYEKIYLVDRNFGNTNLPSNTKVELINMDALPAIDLLKKRGIRIDCFVSLNDGNFEGGGTYPIFSDFLLGYLSPILNDEIMVITDLSYHGAMRMAGHVKKMNWGFDKKEIKPGHKDHIFPSIFSYSHMLQGNANDPKFGSVFKLTRNATNASFELQHGLKINLIYDSIWSLEDKLDLIGLNINSEEQLWNPRITVNDFFFKRKTNTLQIRNMSFEQILDVCREKKIRKLGLTPWLGGNYTALFDELNQLKPGFPEEISFCHLRKEDFRDLYKILVQLEN